MQSQADFINELNANSRARYRAKIFKEMLETAHFSLPFTVTAEEEATFKKFLAARVAGVEAYCDKTFGK